MKREKDLIHKRKEISELQKKLLEEKAKEEEELYYDDEFDPEAFDSGHGQFSDFDDGEDYYYDYDDEFDWHRNPFGDDPVHDQDIFDMQDEAIKAVTHPKKPPVQVKDSAKVPDSMRSRPSHEPASAKAPKKEPAEPIKSARAVPMPDKKKSKKAAQPPADDEESSDFGFEDEEYEDMPRKHHFDEIQEFDQDAYGHELGLPESLGSASPYEDFYSKG